MRALLSWFALGVSVALTVVAVGNAAVGGDRSFTEVVGGLALGISVITAITAVGRWTRVAAIAAAAVSSWAVVSVIFV